MLGADARQHAARELQRLQATTIVPVDAGPPAHVPEHPGRAPASACRRAPRRTRWQLTDSVSWVKGAHTLRVGGELSHTDGRFDLGVFRDGRVELVQDFAEFDLQPRRPRRRQRPAVRGHAAQRQARPGPGARRLQQQLLSRPSCRTTGASTPQLTLNLGLRYELDTNVKNISRLRRHQPDRAALPARATRKRDLDNFGPRLGFDWTNRRGAASSTAATASTTTASRSRSCRSSAASTAARCRSRCAPATCSSSIPSTGSCRRSRRRSPIPSPASSCPARAPRASTSSTTRSQNPTVQQFNLGTRFKLPGDAVLQLDFVHNRGTHFIIGRPIGEVYNPVVGGPDRVVNLESSVGTHYDALLVEPREALRAATSSCASPTPWRARATTRTTTRSPSAAARSTRTTSSASTARPRTSSATAWCSSGSFLLPLELRLSRHLDDRLGRADGHPDARRLEPRADAVSATPAGAQFKTGRRAQRLHRRRSTPAAASTACRCRS